MKTNLFWARSLALLIALLTFSSAAPAQEDDSPDYFRRPLRVQTAAGKQPTIADLARAFASADHGVDFIDEENDLAGSLLNLFQHAFKALFELTAEAGTRQQAGDFQTNEPLIPQRRRYVALNDALRQSLDDSGFTNARLADQHGVILSAPAKDLHSAANFFIPADHWVELAITRQSGEVGAELLEGFLVVLLVHVWWHIFLLVAI